MRIEYQEIKLDSVLNHWVKGYTPIEAEIIKFEAFVDPVKYVVVFKLYVEDKPK